MAWLVGRWAGGGVLEYEGIEAAAYIHELEIDNANQTPYLAFRSTIWLANEHASVVDKEEEGLKTYARLSKDYVWSSLQGFIRPAPEAAKRDDMTILEALTASPAGHSATWAGVIRGPQFQFQADAIAATPTASELSAARVVGGLVQSDLFLAYDMAAFGHELRPYMAGRLSKIVSEGSAES